MDYKEVIIKRRIWLRYSRNSCHSLSASPSPL